MTALVIKPSCHPHLIIELHNLTVFAHLKHLSAFQFLLENNIELDRVRQVC